jgi:hypothetical protein
MKAITRVSTFLWYVTLYSLYEFTVVSGYVLLPFSRSNNKAMKQEKKKQVGVMVFNSFFT